PARDASANRRPGRRHHRRLRVAGARPARPRRRSLRRAGRGDDGREREQRGQDPSRARLRARSVDAVGGDDDPGRRPLSILSRTLDRHAPGRSTGLDALLLCCTRRNNGERRDAGGALPRMPAAVGGGLRVDRTGIPRHGPHAPGRATLARGGGEGCLERLLPCGVPNLRAGARPAGPPGPAAGRPGRDAASSIHRVRRGPPRRMDGSDRLRVTWRQNGVENTETYDHVANALWHGRLRIDVGLGLIPERPWLYRYKIGGWLPHQLGSTAVPSLTLVLGPFGGVGNLGARGVDICLYSTGSDGCVRRESRSKW